MSLPAWPDWTEAQWLEARRVLHSVAKFDESKIHREPAGTSEGGQFAETGGSGTVASDPTLAIQAKAGIAAVEKLIPEAVKTADFSKTPGAWEDLNEEARQKVYEQYVENTYEDIDIQAIDADLTVDVRWNLKEGASVDTAKMVADKTKVWVEGYLGEKVLDEFATDKSLSGGKPLDFKTLSVPDPQKLTDAGYPVLDVKALRHTDGTELTPYEKDHVRGIWKNQYEKVVADEIEKVQDSDEYLAKREQRIREIIKQNWQSLDAQQKIQLATDMRLKGELQGDVIMGVQREPKKWVTGVEEGTLTEDDYARTHAVANRLTELRTDEIRKERGLLEAGVKPTFEVVEATNFNPNRPNYLAKDSAGRIVAASSTREMAQQNAEQWATEMSLKASSVKTPELIEHIWEQWKRSSGEGLSLSVQLAAARELDGHHRMTPAEVAEAEQEAQAYGGIANLQAYIRAQWEVTQTVMHKAGQDKIEVYRGLMLAGDQVKATPHKYLNPKGEPISPPTNIETGISTTSGLPYVRFQFNNEQFVVEKARRPAKDITEIAPLYWHQVDSVTQSKVFAVWQSDADAVGVGKEQAKKLFENLGDLNRFEMMQGYISKGRMEAKAVFPRPFESDEEAINRRLQKYLAPEYQERVTQPVLTQLPILQLQRSGAQSTTGTPSVANAWGGITDFMPPDPTRVVIRIEAPPTSVLSLPVYGENVQEEHESVLLGTKDKWLWDAWAHRAPRFEEHGIAGKPPKPPKPPKTLAEEMREMAALDWSESELALKVDLKPLVIDLQAEDRGKPHWLSSVDWSMNKYSHILKYDPNQPRGPKGSSTGGRWVKGQGLADIAPGYREFPSKPDDPGVAQARQQMGYTSVAPGMERNAGNASYAAIMNAPTGTGFKNPPRGEEVAATLAQIEAVAAAEAKAKSTGGSVKTALSTGSVDEVKKKFDGGVNTSILVEMSDPNHTRAVFKPEVGELWGHGFTNSDIDQYITNKDFSLAEREAMASEVSDALGFTLVPETVHRTSLEGVDPSEYGGDGGSGYDSYELREMYDEYREKAQEKAQDEVSEEMAKLFAEAQQEHVDDIGNRAEEMTGIWNQVVKDYPDSPYGDPEAQREHPALPLGSKPPFERRTEKDVLDPMEVLDEANVDVTAPMNDEEKKRVEDVFRKKLDEGYQELGDVDEDRAREHLQWDDWLPLHENTEAKLLDERVKTFESWKETFGYRDNASDGPQNQDAPHPNGGSLQRFVPHLRGYGDMSHEDATRMAVLDYVIGSMDRHGNNLMFDGDQPVAIDNGYSMPGSDQPDNFQFRSVAVSEWLSDVRHKKVPEPLRQSILNEIDKTNWQSLVDRHPNMSREEREAFLGRVANMKEALSYDEGLSTLWHDQQLMRY